MEVNKLDPFKLLKDSHIKECEALGKMRDENLKIIKLNFEQALKAKSKSELLTLAVNVSAMRTLFEINKENLVKRPSFKINDESFVLPDVYEFLINKVIQLEKFIDTRILAIKDEEPVLIIKHTIKKDDSEIQNIFDHCNKDIFDCEYKTFRESIETANFNNLGIKRLNKVQYLTHRLSGIMDNVWYTDICRNMNWTKNLCSGKRDKIKDQRWTKQFEKILPLPKKE